MPRMLPSGPLERSLEQEPKRRLLSGVNKIGGARVDMEQTSFIRLSWPKYRCASGPFATPQKATSLHS